MKSRATFSKGKRGEACRENSEAWKKLTDEEKKPFHELS